MYKVTLLLIALSTLCLAGDSGLCYFPPPAPMSESCLEPNGSGGCNGCKSGYGLMVAQCYPGCPSGYTQLMPSYCINSTVIKQHQNFDLCPTNATFIASGGYDMCYEQPGGTCQCGPACPAGYAPLACSCTWVGGQNSAEVYETQGFMYYFLSAIGLLTIIFALFYAVYSFWPRSVKEVEQSKPAQIEATGYSKMISEKV